MTTNSETGLADRFTISYAKVETFSDLMDNFERNPMTGLLARVTNEDAVKQSIRNLILTDRTERPYRPYIGSRVSSMLFDPIDVATEEMLRITISETIENCEPRANLIRVDVIANEAAEAYLVNVVFSVKSIPESTFDMGVALRRIR